MVGRGVWIDDGAGCWVRGRLDLRIGRLVWGRDGCGFGRALRFHDGGLGLALRDWFRTRAWSGGEFGGSEDRGGEAEGFSGRGICPEFRQDGDLGGVADIGGEEELALRLRVGELGDEAFGLRFFEDFKESEERDLVVKGELFEGMGVVEAVGNHHGLLEVLDELDGFIGGEVGVGRGHAEKIPVGRGGWKCNVRRMFGRLT